MEKTEQALSLFMDRLQDIPNEELNDLAIKVIVAMMTDLRSARTIKGFMMQKIEMQHEEILELRAELPQYTLCDGCPFLPRHDDHSDDVYGTKIEGGYHNV